VKTSNPTILSVVLFKPYLKPKLKLKSGYEIEGIVGRIHRAQFP
jgi:hypothetical protein